MLKAIIAVGLGSCTGGILRYLVSKLSDSVTDGRFPLGTLAVNLAGCLIIGILSALAEKGGIANANVRLFLTVGICGGFTTFSTFMNESFQMVRDERYAILLAYMAASIFGGFLLYSPVTPWQGTCSTESPRKRQDSYRQYETG